MTPPAKRGSRKGKEADAEWHRNNKHGVKIPGVATKSVRGDTASGPARRIGRRAEVEARTLRGSGDHHPRGCEKCV